MPILIFIVRLLPGKHRDPTRRLRSTMSTTSHMQGCNPAEHLLSARLAVPCPSKMLCADDGVGQGLTERLC